MPFASVTSVPSTTCQPGKTSALTKVTEAPSSGSPPASATLISARGCTTFSAGQQPLSASAATISPIARCTCNGSSLAVPRSAIRRRVAQRNQHDADQNLHTPGRDLLGDDVMADAFVPDANGRSIREHELRKLNGAPADLNCGCRVTVVLTPTEKGIVVWQKDELRQALKLA